MAKQEPDYVLLVLLRSHVKRRETELRLRVDRTAILDEQFDHVKFATQRGYMEGGVTLL